MKILAVAPYYLPYTSGMTIYLKRLLEGLAANGHSVCILTTRHDKSLPEKESIHGVDVIREPVLFRMQRGSFAPVISWRLHSLARDYDAVNIHAPFFEAGLLSLIAKSSGKKVFLTYHCDLKMRDGLVSKAVENVYYLSVRKAAADSEKIIANSLDYLSNSRLKGYADKTVSIFPPIDTEKFSRKNDTEKFRKGYGIGKDDLVVGFLGRLTHEKGLEYLVRAAPLIKKQFPRAKILIAGEGDDIAGGAKESVKAKLKEYIIKEMLDNVVFTGRLPEDGLSDYYSSCDVFVLPSIDPLESFGMVQVEAMLCGTPVVATDIPGVREPITLTGSGILVPPGDSESLANAVIEILKEKKRYQPIREKILEYFGTEKTVKEYEKVFGT